MSAVRRCDDLRDDEGRNQERRAEDHLSGRLGEGCLGVAGEVTSRVRKGHTVTTDRADAGERPEELTGAKSFPHAQYHQHAEEAQDQADDPFARRLLFGERDQQDGQRRQRRHGVDETGEDRRHVRFAVGEEREGHAAEQNRHDR